MLNTEHKVHFENSVQMLKSQGCGILISGILLLLLIFLRMERVQNIHDRWTNVEIAQNIWGVMLLECFVGANIPRNAK